MPKRSFGPVQGPPGTGKTFTGAHVIRTLVQQDKRVGVTAMSHHAIDNLMQAVVDRFAEEGEELRAVREICVMTSLPGCIGQPRRRDGESDSTLLPAASTTSK